MQCPATHQSESTTRGLTSLRVCYLLLATDGSSLPSTGLPSEPFSVCFGAFTVLGRGHCLRANEYGTSGKATRIRPILFNRLQQLRIGRTPPALARPRPYFCNRNMAARVLMKLTFKTVDQSRALYVCRTSGGCWLVTFRANRLLPA
jgi:hypothetical protein